MQLRQIAKPMKAVSGGGFHSLLLGTDSFAQAVSLCWSWVKTSTQRLEAHWKQDVRQATGMNTFGQLGDGSYVCSSGSNAFILETFSCLFMRCLETWRISFRAAKVSKVSPVPAIDSATLSVHLLKFSNYIEVDDRCWRMFLQLLLAALFLANRGMSG